MATKAIARQARWVRSMRRGRELKGVRHSAVLFTLTVTSGTSPIGQLAFACSELSQESVVSVSRDLFRC